MQDDRVVLKEDRVMVVTDRRGDVPAGNEDGLGMYLSDTRFLSTLELRINRQRPILLSASIDESYVATIQMVNPRLLVADNEVPRQTISIRRTRFVHRGLHERIGVQNCLAGPVAIELSLDFDADFKDIFDVRQLTRLEFLGKQRPLRATATGLLFTYEGLDEVQRTTEVRLDPPPHRRRGRNVTYALTLGAHETRTIEVDIIPRIHGEQELPELNFEAATDSLARSYASWVDSCSRVTTDNQQLNRLLTRSILDIRTLLTNYPTGPYPMAGIPWFCVPFGRDGSIVGCQALMLHPEICRGVLRYLAAHQGRRHERTREEEPGKIMHEMRAGELANLRQIPHTPYYGSVDATPLFLVGLVELMQWCWDVDFFNELEPAVLAALAWIDSNGDLDGDGLLEFQPHARHGIRNQGWKDSHDSLAHTDGSMAEVPAALIEVQGYVYRAKSGLAEIFAALGQQRLAERLRKEAAALRQLIDSRFWMQDIGFHAQALDRDKRPVAAVSSNPGHCLWSGALPRTRARQVARRLTSADMFSGWGVRTLSSLAPTYNPMSYHNGSIWPHDNSIIADGMARYGLRAEAAAVVHAGFEAGMRMPNLRLPELFCGFNRDYRFDSAPAQYLVSGLPQAWASGAAIHFLQTAIGIRPDARNHRLVIAPLPMGTLCRQVTIEGLRLGDERISFRVDWTAAGSARVRVLENKGGIEVLTAAR